METNGFVPSIKETEIADSSMKAVRIKGKPILLVRVGGEVFGVSNFCPHMGCQLQGGILRGYVVMCPCHGWKFDVRTGQYEEIKEIALETYSCKVQNGKIYVRLNKET